jgi:hypothetical protein
MKKTSMFRNVIVIIAIIGLAIAASSAMAEAAPSSAKISLITPVSGSFEMGQAQTVKWYTSNYSGSTVSIRLIRKVSSNPNTYEVVRTISDATANDGAATWIPSGAEAGLSGLSLEIGCAPSAKACQSGTATGSSLAVIKSTRYSNTASAFKALEAMNNR